jgi:double-stranded uracil-DNA glycosylase
MSDDEIRTGLSPIARDDATLLILGSLPGDASLLAARYYAHPRNQFWQLIGHVTGEDFPSLAYEDRLEALARCGIALWDMVAQGRRKGSLDANLRVVTLNEVEGLIACLPLLRAIAFNGAKAAKIGIRVGAYLPLTRISLPSSSPAQTLDVREKMVAWRALNAFVRRRNNPQDAPFALDQHF